MPGVHVFLQFKILQFIVKFLHFNWFVFQRKKEKERTIAPILWCGSKITPQMFPLTHSLKEACRSASGGQPNTHFGRDKMSMKSGALSESSRAFYQVLDGFWLRNKGIRQSHKTFIESMTFRFSSWKVGEWNLWGMSFINKYFLFLQKAKRKK